MAGVPGKVFQQFREAFPGRIPCDSIVAHRRSLAQTVNRTRAKNREEAGDFPISVSSHAQIQRGNAHAQTAKSQPECSMQDGYLVPVSVHKNAS